jgi:hypothetical protein
MRDLRSMYYVIQLVPVHRTNIVIITLLGFDDFGDALAQSSKTMLTEQSIRLSFFAKSQGK